jgi:hypothetical protein
VSFARESQTYLMLKQLISNTRQKVLIVSMTKNAYTQKLVIIAAYTNSKALVSEEWKYGLIPKSRSAFASRAPKAERNIRLW